MNNLEQWFKRMPVVAILRGVRPEEVLAIAESILDAGIGVIEVPLNSPDPFNSIERLSGALGDEAVVGAGTVVTLEEAEKVAKAGGKIVVTPNVNPAIIERCIELGMIPMPGWAAPTEAFAAYHAGARYLKLFPASTYGPKHVTAVKAVLPNDAFILAVGGAGSKNVGEWLDAGVAGFGIASELYSPGSSADEVGTRAKAIVAAVANALQK